MQHTYIQAHYTASSGCSCSLSIFAKSFSLQTGQPLSSFEFFPVLEMEFPMLKSAFFVFSLKTGTTIIGSLNFILIVVFCYAIDDGSTVVKDVGQVLDDLHLVNVEAWKEDELKFITAQKYILVVMGATIVFMTFSNHLLLRGVRKTRPGLILFWLCINTVISMMSFVACVVELWALVYVVYNMYCSWVVACYYREVLDTIDQIHCQCRYYVADQDDLADGGGIDLQIR